MNIKTLLAFVALTLIQIHCMAFAASGQELFNEAMTRENELRSRAQGVQKSDYSTLIEMYSAALASSDLSNSDRLRALVSRGRLYVQTGECLLAIQDLDNAIQNGWRDAAAYVARAYCHGQAGSLNAARKDLDAAISINAKDAVLYRERAMVLAEQKMYAEAIRDFSRSIDLMKPTRSSDLYVMRGDAYIAQGAYERAIEDYGQAVHATKENAEKLFSSKLSPRSSSLRPLYEKLSDAYRDLARASDPAK